VTLRQIHSDLIHVIDQKTKLTTGMRGDGLVTDRSGLLLSILAADCLPVLLVDTERRVVAALHCGWRGTAKRIAEKAVGLLRQRFGSRPEDIRAAIGPGIRACCYRVGKDVAAEFEAQFIYAREILRFHKEVSLLEKKYPLVFRFQPRGHPPVDDRIVRLDLVAANARQLRDAGVSAANIWSDAPCTHCNAEMFFSHRRDAGVTGRMMAVVGIRREIRPPAAKGRRARIRRDSQA